MFFPSILYIWGFFIFFFNGVFLKTVAECNAFLPGGFVYSKLENRKPA